MNALLKVSRAAAACALLILLSALVMAQSPSDIRYISVPLANIHRNPDGASELVTQALLWEAVQITGEKGRWYKIFVSDQYRTDKGYPGWVLKVHVQKAKKPDAQWMSVVPKAGLRKAPDAKSPVVSWAYLGCKLSTPDEEAQTSPEWLAVNLPGQKDPVWMARKQAVNCQAVQRPSEGTPVVETASLLKGTHYVWGGMTSQGIDCSGLTYASYRRHGYSIPRDADQQFTSGTAVDAEQLEAGDLLFFGKDADHITHVGMYIGDGKFIHASSSLGGVTVSQFGEPKFQERFQGARRYLK